MLFYLYLNMACCYMNMCHFSEARVLLDDALKLAPNNSLQLFRSAQCRAFSLDSSEADIRLAIEEVKKAKEAKKTEKIFQHPPNLLKMLNVHNLEEALSELELLLDNRLKELTLLKTARLEKVFSRVAQINEVEQVIISEGRVPEEGPDIYSLFNDDENMEDTILRGMLDKYLTVIDFYQETVEDTRTRFTA